MDCHTTRSFQNKGMLILPGVSQCHLDCCKCLTPGGLVAKYHMPFLQPLQPFTQFSHYHLALPCGQAATEPLVPGALLWLCSRATPCQAAVVQCIALLLRCHCLHCSCSDAPFPAAAARLTWLACYDSATRTLLLQAYLCR